MKLLAGLLLGIVLSCSAHAQISVVPVNNGTGTLTSIPIPGGSGLYVTVGTGSAATPLQNINNNPAAQQLQLGDDSSQNVPLGFTFPYWGQTFTQSWMYSNGIVSFKDGNIPGAGCCGGQDLTTLRDPAYNYAIMPLWTDLIDTTGQSTWVLKNNNSAVYGWYGTKEYGTGNSNSFEVAINSSGAVNVRYGSAFVSQGHMVTSGMTGNLANGEYFQYYYGAGFNIPSTNPVSWGIGSTVDMCTVNPLSSPTCPTYQSAYLTQQCSYSALYDPSCPGYATAYHDQQCSLNSLFATDCPGYRQAYHDQQCSINPLYATDCTGYDQAYHDQQCSTNPLYATDCAGYASAYLTQQCTANPLYSTACSGYADAYFSQQCQLNGLYDQKCPNYATAYATKMLLEQQGTASIVATAGTVAAMAPTTTTVSNDGTVSATPSATGSTTVDKALPPPATSANSAAAPAAPVQLVQPPPPPPPAPREERREERKPEGGPQGGQPPQGQQPQGGEKPQPTARQQLAERRAEAAKREAVEKGKNLANEMGKAADMESQKQVQNIVIQAMGFTPGFDAYGKTIIPDVSGYRPFTVYNNQVNVDNKRLGWGLYGPSDRLHNDLVDSQFKER